MVSACFSNKKHHQKQLELSSCHSPRGAHAIGQRFVQEWRQCIITCPADWKAERYTKSVGLSPTALLIKGSQPTPVAAVAVKICHFFFVLILGTGFSLVLQPAAIKSESILWLHLSSNLGFEEHFILGSFTSTRISVTLRPGAWYPPGYSCQYLRY